MLESGIGAASYGSFRSKLAENSGFPKLCLGAGGPEIENSLSTECVSGILPASQQACIIMLPDDLPPRIPEQRREVRSYSPGGTPRQREAFQVRRSGGVVEAKSRGVRRQARIIKRHHEVWIGVVVLGIVLVVAGGLWMASRGRAVPAAAAAARDESDTNARVRGVWRGPIPAEVAEKFTAATTHEERLRWVRNPEEVGPLMEKFFREGPGASEKVAQTILANSTSNGDILFENFEVLMQDGVPRLLSVTVDPEGAKVDFKAYARHGSESWEDLLSGAVESAGEMRVMLKPGGFYMHRFPDESRWLHFEASTPDLPESMDFYVERESETARALAGAEGGLFPATVSLRADGDSAQQRQFEITSLVAVGWAEPGK